MISGVHTLQPLCFVAVENLDTGSWNVLGGVMTILERLQATTRPHIDAIHAMNGATRKGKTSAVWYCMWCVWVCNVHYPYMWCICV